MRRVAWACCRISASEAGVGRVLQLLVLWICLWPVANARVQEVNLAVVTASVDGELQHKEHSLPYYWDRLHSNRSGTATFDLDFSVADTEPGPYGLFIARVGNTAEVWLNGFLLTRLGDINVSNVLDYAKKPQFLLIPAQLLKSQNHLRILIQADGGRRGGLSAVVVGPEAQVREIYEYEYRWRVTGSMAVAIVSLVVGAMALALWAAHGEPSQPGEPRRDGVYLSAALAELCWFVRLMDIGLVEPPLAWPYWELVQISAYAGWICCTAMFFHQVAGWHRRESMRWVRPFLWSLWLTAAPASYLANTLHQEIFLTAWLGVASFLFLGYGAVYFWRAMGQGNKEFRLMGFVGLLNVLVAMRDWLVIRVSGSFDFVPWLRFSSLLMGLALGFIVLTRFRAASRQARDLMTHMAERVAEKEQALVASYGQLDQLTREQERGAERSRVLRDMHDGVGAHISSAIRQLQSGNVSNGELLQTLRDSLDQLKLSVDAMNLPAGDIAALLASLRYRLEPRLKAAGIDLQWDVRFLAPLSRLDHKGMRQLQFMLLEAVSNVLQHSHADVLRFELRATTQGGAMVRVIDNGCGFEMERVNQRGLSSLRERAAALGAPLHIASEPGQTVVEIILK